ncbi:hypothetical protein GXW82_33450 [Streptacidiphilus sp. 4-A2]|nr:hypothetical protein [Streptacidiphilus sp. 4-A2]
MADRSEAPVETSTGSIDDTVPTDDVEMTRATDDDSASEADAATAAEPEAAEAAAAGKAPADKDPADAPAADAEPVDVAEAAEPAGPAEPEPESRPAKPAATKPAAEPAEPAEPESEDKPVADTDDPEPAAPALPELLPVPVRHSGDRIGNRYRLEECVAEGEGFSSWRAMDEKLRRAVGVHLLASGQQRAKETVEAARQAALLGDPRFVQVLDAVEDGELVYIVREWLPTPPTSPPCSPTDRWSPTRPTSWCGRSPTRWPPPTGADSPICG